MRGDYLGWEKPGFRGLGGALRLIAAAISLALLLPVGILRSEDRGDARTVYGATHPSTFALFALDPDLLGGWNTALRDYERRFIPERYQSLPILGGWYGDGYTPNREVLLSSGLLKALYLGGADLHDRQGIAAALRELGMEIVFAPTGFEEIPETFRTMGRAFDRVERGEALALYAEEVLERLTFSVARLPPDRRPRVYLALDSDGLASLCQRSDRSDTVVWAGGENVYDCPEAMAASNLRLGIEEVMRLDPDYVLVFSPELAAKIETDPSWRRIRAVEEGRWRLVPRGPFSWLERPATYMRLVGVQWLANWLHPDLYPLDMAAELERFMVLFFGVTPAGAGLEEFVK